MRTTTVSRPVPRHHRTRPRRRCRGAPPAGRPCAHAQRRTRSSSPRRGIALVCAGMQRSSVAGAKRPSPPCLPFGRTRSVLVRNAAGRPWPCMERVQFGPLEWYTIGCMAANSVHNATFTGTRRLRDVCPLRLQMAQRLPCYDTSIHIQQFYVSTLQCIANVLSPQPTTAPIQPNDGDAIRLVIMQSPQGLSASERSRSWRRLSPRGAPLSSEPRVESSELRANTAQSSASTRS